MDLEGDLLISSFSAESAADLAVFCLLFLLPWWEEKGDEGSAGSSFCVDVPSCLLAGLQAGLGWRLRPDRRGESGCRPRR